MTEERDDLRAVSPPRQLTAREHALFEQLLQSPFDGRDEIRLQVASAHVVAEGHDDTRTIRLVVTSSGVPRAKTTLRIPVEAEALDEDGVPIAVLLHVVDGVVDELEIYRVDGEPVRQRDLSELHSVSIN